LFGGWHCTFKICTAHIVINHSCDKSTTTNKLIIFVLLQKFHLVAIIILKRRTIFNYFQSVNFFFHG